MYTNDDYAVGDKVRVIFEEPPDPREPPSWENEMNKYAGEIGTVEAIDDRWIRVRFNDGEYYMYKPSWLIPQKYLEGGDLPKTAKVVARTFAEYLQNKKVL